MKRFFTELNEAGLIPVSLVAWQLTGKRSAVGAPRDHQRYRAAVPLVPSMLEGLVSQERRNRQLPARYGPGAALDRAGCCRITAWCRTLTGEGSTGAASPRL